MLLSSADFFQIYLFQKVLSRTLSVSNGLDPDKDQSSVGPDLGPYCLQRLSADTNSRCSLCICKKMSSFALK